jgi:RHS repeat-associated protein
LSLTNPHGDVIATASDSVAASGVTSYSEATEYGAPRAAANAYATYGSFGGQQRSSNGLGGLVFMGVRLYNPNTGLFLSVDPAAGGNANGYCYPRDPVNSADVSGAWSDFFFNQGGAWHSIRNVLWFHIQMSVGSGVQWVIRFPNTVKRQYYWTYVRAKMTVSGRGTNWHYRHSGTPYEWMHGSIGHFKYSNSDHWWNANHWITGYRSVFFTLEFTVTLYGPWACQTYYFDEHVHFTSNEY